MRKWEKICGWVSLTDCCIVVMCTGGETSVHANVDLLWCQKCSEGWRSIDSVENIFLSPNCFKIYIRELNALKLVWIASDFDIERFIYVYRFTGRVITYSCMSSNFLPNTNIHTHVLGTFASASKFIVSLAALARDNFAVNVLFFLKCWPSMNWIHYSW